MAGKFSPSGTIQSASLENFQGGSTVGCQAKLQDGSVIWLATQHGHGEGEEVTYQGYQGKTYQSSEVKRWI